MQHFPLPAAQKKILMQYLAILLTIPDIANAWGSVYMSVTYPCVLVLVFRENGEEEKKEEAKPHPVSLAKLVSGKWCAITIRYMMYGLFVFASLDNCVYSYYCS